jgi:DoxX
MKRHFLLDPAARILWLKVVIVIAFAIGLVMSVPLWLSSRSYPYAPVVNGLPAITHPFDWILFGCLLFLLVAISISSKPQKYIWFFLGIIALLCLYDQTRWQPYIYQYGFLLATLGLFSWRKGDIAGSARTLNIARLIVASTYIYSGLQKANAGFVNGVFPWLTQPITHILPSLTTPLYFFGFVAPVIQISFGIGLLTKRFRRVSLLLAVAMHIFILTMIGPWGLNWNSIVWPWTIAMIFFDILLFAGAEFSFREVFFPKNSLFHVLVLVLFGVMPLFSFFNLWDSDLSAALYSGNLTEGNIYVSNIGRNALPQDLQPYVTQISANNNVLNIKNWATGDMDIIEYPETRVFKDIARNVCSYMTDPTQMVLVVQEAHLFRNNPQTVYHCGDL